MKKFSIFGLVAIIAFFGFTACDDGDGDGGGGGGGGFTFEYELGATGPGGGKIFYRSASGFTMTDNSQVCHYLEAAPSNMATTLAWASSTYIGTDNWLDISGTSQAIGTGRKNTALILVADAAAPAAKACKEYTNNEKEDWFLPSQLELYQLFVNRVHVGNMGTDNYWTSSQGTGGTPLGGWAYFISLEYGILSNANSKGVPQRVRAVRAF